MNYYRLFELLLLSILGGVIGFGCYESWMFLWALALLVPAAIGYALMDIRPWPYE